MAFKEFYQFSHLPRMAKWQEKQGLLFSTFTLERAGFPSYLPNAWLLSGFAEIRLISNLVTTLRHRLSSHTKSVFLFFELQPTGAILLSPWMRHVVIL